MSPKIEPEKFIEPPTCKRCGVVISQEAWDNAINIHWLPLCDKCDPELKAKFKKWSPIFQQLKLRR
jgi:NAD-dependent SIR2 family protein deacetylase